MKIARIIKNWHSPNLMRQSPENKGIWDGIQFTIDPIEECDYLIVLNYVPVDTIVKCVSENLWLVLQEPYIPGTFDWMVEGHEPFSRVFTHHIFSVNKKYIKTQTCLPWHINRTYDELSNMEIPVKDKKASCISSRKEYFPGHKIRTAFLKKLIDNEIIDIDIYGFGINPLNDKWDGLAPYKYSIAIENSSSEDYWTEKISDCFLSYTLPIYYGCSNLDKYFPSESYIQIDINDFQKSIDKINKVIKEDTWENRLEYIKEARELVLTKYQFFPFIANEINSFDSKNLVKKNIYFNSYKKGQKMPVETGVIISVVVCTYNRENVLRDCLKSIAMQDIDDSLYEVIVVNNNSTDNTQKVINEFVQENTNFSSFFEPKQGLSNARNLGLKKAEGKYIGFIDDDARVSNDWIVTALKIIVDKQPDIFGGPALPLFMNEKPIWFRDEYGIRGDMGDTGWIEKGHIVGTNFFIKKSLLKEYGGFDPKLGMKGNNIGYHEETSIIFRAFEEKKKVYFSKDLAVEDLIPDYKKSLAFFILKNYKAGSDGLRLWKPKYKLSELYHLLKIIDDTMNEIDFALMKRDVSQFRHPENYIIEKVIENFSKIGIRTAFFLKEEVLKLNLKNLLQKDDLQNQIDNQIKLLSQKYELLAQKDHQLTQKDHQLIQKDRQLTQKDQQLTQKDRQVGIYREKIDQLNSQIQNLINSHSYRIGRMLLLPFSIIKRFFRKLKL